MITNNLQTMVENCEEGDSLELINKIFSNDMLSDISLQCSLLGQLTFLNVKFNNLNFMGSNFLKCEFQNCIIQDTIFRKCEFRNCNFENCQIEKCNFTRVAFYNGNFRNCSFLDTNLRASDFSDFEFIETRFNNSTLNFIIVQTIQICNSNKSIKIEESSNFEKILKDFDLISNDEI